ncbi:hypothetical protein [Streptomyces sp. NBC_00342]|uniref:hypothetical protein n=1 Tax=Streptomyces sp. NBC_00342 TaxID=2975718 RepID=UPI002E2DBBB2|nr:hypothetical protein [Streptomyces sp. NBC_00342]
MQSLLTGYRVALGVHGIEEPFAFWPEDDFNRWLQVRRGIAVPFTWAAEVERSTPVGSTPVEEFFRLLDDFRREDARDLTPDATTNRRPGNE